MPTLTAIQKQYILHWGEMGTRWGINRTVAQIHALLYLSPQPLAADEIAETLTVARSNVSTSIRELESWGIIRPVHVLGERREHYESLKDVWEMFRIIVEQRKRREVDPTLQLLRNCLEELKRELGAGRESFADRDALERAVRDLAAAGLLYRETEFVESVPPTVALEALTRTGGR